MKMIGSVVEKQHAKVVQEIRCPSFPSRGFPRKSVKPSKKSPSSECSDEILTEIQSLISSRNIDFLRSDTGITKIQEALQLLNEETAIPVELTTIQESREMLFSFEGRLIATELEAISLVYESWKQSVNYSPNADALFSQMATSLVGEFRADLLSSNEEGLEIADVYQVLHITQSILF